MEVLIINSVRLSNLLTQYNIVGNVREAKKFIDSGLVKVDGKTVSAEVMIRARKDFQPIEIEVKGY